jgi:hypothetical protein
LIDWLINSTETTRYQTYEKIYVEEKSGRGKTEFRKELAEEDGLLWRVRVSEVLSFRGRSSDARLDAVGPRDGAASDEKGVTHGGVRGVKVCAPVWVQVGVEANDRCII